MVVDKSCPKGLVSSKFLGELSERNGLVVGEAGTALIHTSK